MSRAAGLAIALAAACPACTGASGTIAITIVTAPDSTVMDDVTHVRMTLSEPFQVVEADRDADGGFDLAIDVIAEGPSGEVIFEGEDAAGDVIAFGRTPPLPIAAIDADIAIYVAAPRSLAAAPEDLGVGRTEIGVAPLEYGTLLAGGRDATGAPTTDLVIYNAYDHEVQPGEDLPEARAGLSVGSGALGYVYLFGGEDVEGDPRGSLWRFDTTIEPDGDWLAGTEDADLARTGAAIAPLGNDSFLITGEPAVFLEGLFLRAAPIDTSVALAAGGAATVQVDELPGAPIFTLVAGQGAAGTGIARLAEGAFQEEAAPADALRTGHAVVPTLRDEILIVGGADTAGPLTSVIRCDPAERSYISVPGVLAVGRTGAAIAANSTYLIVAGGRDAAGDLVPDAEVFRIDDLSPVGTIPMVVPRAGAVARAMPNQQILIAGGVDAAGDPVAILELFTPDVPEISP
jgi:hypothetical protein